MLSHDKSPFNKLVDSGIGAVFCQQTHNGNVCFCNPGFRGSNCLISKYFSAALYVHASLLRFSDFPFTVIALSSLTSPGNTSHTSYVHLPYFLCIKKSTCFSK